MKKERTKGFITGMLVMALAIGMIGTAAATVGQKAVNLDYKNINITLNGKKVTPTDAKGNTVEPFSIDGTVYLPVRAVGNALGLEVNWNGTASIVELTEKELPAVPADPFYEDSAIPRFDFVLGKTEFVEGFLSESEPTVMAYAYEDALSEERDFATLKTLYETMIKKLGFSQSFTGKVKNDPFYVYKSSKVAGEVTFAQVTRSDGSVEIMVTVEVPRGSKATTGGGSSTGGGNSSGGSSSEGSSGGESSGSDRNLQLYLSDKAALDASYQAERSRLVDAVNTEKANYDRVLGWLPQPDELTINNARQRYESAQAAVEKCDSKYQSDLSALQSKYGI